MKGWILKVLHPNIYGNHQWEYQNSYDTIWPTNTGGDIHRRMRNYKCSKCGQELSMYSKHPRVVEPAILWYDDCNEAQMNEALK